MSIRISQSPYGGMWETVVGKIIELLNKRFEKASFYMNLCEVDRVYK